MQARSTGYQTLCGVDPCCTLAAVWSQEIPRAASSDSRQSGAVAQIRLKWRAKDPWWKRIWDQADGACMCMLDASRGALPDSQQYSRLSRACLGPPLAHGSGTTSGDSMGKGRGICTTISEEVVVAESLIITYRLCCTFTLLNASMRQSVVQTLWMLVKAAQLTTRQRPR